MVKAKKKSTPNIKELYLTEFHLEEVILLNRLKTYIPLKLELKNIVEYQNHILFIQNHPKGDRIFIWARQELVRITTWCFRNKNLINEKLYNSGLPFSSAYSFFSYTFCEWLSLQNISLELNNYEEEGFGFKEFLKYTLPSFIRESVESNFSNKEWFEYLKIKDKDYLKFILGQFSKLNSYSILRDTLFEKQQLAIGAHPKDKSISTCWNSLPQEEVFYHRDWMKKITTEDWIKMPIPHEVPLTNADRQSIHSVSKIKLLILQRETDPVTYMELSSIRYYKLERGISIAIFTMTLDKQLPYESYVGYTLFKNSYPAAYGGAWICGHHALIGINIFEWCRGGESSLFFNNLLRVYHQIFEVEHFEVEPSQYGKDNPEGIDSGAFWFYYRMGFKPIDKNLRSIALKEYDQIRKDRNYRSPRKTLEKFTESNIILNLSSNKYRDISSIKFEISKFVSKNYKDHFNVAEKDAIQFILDFFEDYSIDQKIPISILSEFGLLIMTFKIQKNNREQLFQCINNRMDNVYLYQNYWRQIFSKK